MKLFVRGLLLLVTLVVLQQGLTYAQDFDFGTIQNVRLPLQQHANGRVKVELQADSAEMPAKGPIIATNVTILMFKENGVLDGMLEVDACEYDRRKKQAECYGKVVLRQSDVTISGLDATMYGAQDRLKLHNNVVVEFEHENGVFGGKL